MPHALWAAVPGAVVAHAARFTCSRSFGWLGRRLAQRLHGASWQSKLKPGAPAEFAERAFYALCHLACSFWGGRVCYSHGWLTWDGANFFTTPWPHHLAPEQHARVASYFAVEAALALESTMQLMRSAMRHNARRDSMMMVHHGITLALIGMSWTEGLPETGDPPPGPMS